MASTELVLTANAVRVPHAATTAVELRNMSAEPSVVIDIAGVKTNLYGVKATCYSAVKKRCAALDWYLANASAAFCDLKYTKIGGIRMECVTAEAALVSLVPNHVKKLFERRPGAPPNNARIQAELARVKFCLDYIKFDVTTKQYLWLISNSPNLWVLHYNRVAFVEPTDAIRVLSSGDISAMTVTGKNSRRARLEFFKVVRPTDKCDNLRAVIIAGEAGLAALPSMPGRAAAAPTPTAPPPADPPRATTGGKTSIRPAAPTIDFSLGIPLVVNAHAAPPPTIPDTQSDSDDAFMSDSDASSSDEDSHYAHAHTPVPDNGHVAAAASPAAPPLRTELDATDRHDAPDACTSPDDIESESDSDGSGTDTSDSECDDVDGVPTYERITNDETIAGLPVSASALCTSYVSKMYKAGREGNVPTTAYLEEDYRVALELKRNAEMISRSIRETDAMIASAMRTIHLLKRKREVLIELRDEATTQIMMGERIAGSEVAIGLAKSYAAAKKARYENPAREQAIICALGQ